MLSPIAEELAVACCEFNALADQPLCLHDIKEVVKVLAHHDVSDQIVKDFVARNKDSPSFKSGKMRCPSRVAHTIVAETERFIESWGQLVERNRMVSFNLMVFDETARVCCVREQQLCVQIPFSSNNGRTLFKGNSPDVFVQPTTIFGTCG